METVKEVTQTALIGIGALFCWYWVVYFTVAAYYRAKAMNEQVMPPLGPFYKMNNKDSEKE